MIARGRAPGFLLSLLATPIALPGCGERKSPTTQLTSVPKERHKKLYLSCGHGIRQAVQAIVRAFESETGVEVCCRFGHAGDLLSQLMEGKDADLYVAGDVFGPTEKANLDPCETGM